MVHYRGLSLLTGNSLSIKASAIFPPVICTIIGATGAGILVMVVRYSQFHSRHSKLGVMARETGQKKGAKSLKGSYVKDTLLFPPFSHTFSYFFVPSG